ncbi:Chemotaxis protein CheW [Lacunisphaera limnophila]|uniref:Chemotaxis protein CheW n=1 Tax=Lacunisphaera limnophila TaxID=1838286 RepID=A0A1D8AXL7_9BACT|nr:chemotaxis protein CheW [Lacunisphaera limnophila]AOS45617.1 Chemotaxis protein CheW [Lacunisphaera limnophila]
MSTSRQYCTFLINHLLMGIDVLEVQEVIRGRPLTPVPLAPDAVHGLINLRGQIVTAVDLRRRLALPGRAPEAPTMLIVVRLGAEVAALIADDIGDVLEVDTASFELPPETLSPAAQHLIIGVQKLPQRLLHILDAARCADVAA